MRRYETTTVPASIRQKKDIATKYGKPSRQLTAEDFEIVQEHEEQQLVEVCCDVCGAKAEYFEPDTHNECESSLLSIQVYKGVKETDNTEEYTSEFFKDYWYEVCEACMRHTIVPYLQSLQSIHTPSSTSHPKEEDPALVSAMEDSWRFNTRPQEQLIGREDEMLPTTLPPSSADEPF